MNSESQPVELSYAPPSYPSHKYEGEGWIYVLRVGDEPSDFVGWLTITDDRGKVGFIGTEPPWTDGGFWRTWVQDALRQGARDGVPLAETVDKVLATVLHDRPATFGPLGGLEGLIGT